MTFRTSMPKAPLRSTRARHILRGLALIGGLGFTSALVASCSLVVSTDPLSCTEDTDCVNHTGLTKCDVATRTCVNADECADSSECGSGKICTFTEPRVCLPIKQGDCSTVIPDDPAVYQDRDAILVGVSAPITEGGSPSDTGVSIRNAAELAVIEINGQGGANGKRPIALIVCDDKGERNIAEDQGQQLADLGVQVIVGPAYSGQTIDMTTGPLHDDKGTISRGILSISTSATSTRITGIEDEAPSCAGESGCPGLLWRTAPSDLLQGAAIASYMPTLEEVVKSRVDPPQTGLKVAVLFKGDDYGKNLTDYMKLNVRVNGNIINVDPDTILVNYGDTSVEGTAPDPAKVAQAVEHQADLYIMVGTNELGGIIETIEAGWTRPSAERPFYLFTDGGLIADVIDPAVAANARRRVRGTVPGVLKTADTDPIASFTAEYNNQFAAEEHGGPEIFGAAGAYDAMYLIAYSVAAAGNNPLTGEQLARGLMKVSDPDGTAIIVGPSDLGKGNNAMQSGGTIQFTGASGLLDFDSQTGEANSDIQIWCVDDSKGVSSGFQYKVDPDGGGEMDGRSDPGIAGTCPFPI